MQYTLVLLSLNEIDGLKAIWPQIPKNSVDEIFAVDGGSNDGTLEFYRKNKIKVINQKSKGRGEAFRIGIKHAKGDVVIFFSPDGNEDPADISKFKSYFEKDENLDILIASRMMEGAYNEEDTGMFKPRKWVNNAFNFAANLLFRRKGNYVTDTINGFRAIKKSSFLKLKPHSMKHTIEYEMTIKAFKHKMNIREFPTTEGPRIGGYIKAKSLPTGIDFIRLFFLEVWDSIYKNLHIVLLLAIITVQIITLRQGMHWNIKNNPDLHYSIHIDEVAEILTTLKLGESRNGSKTPTWLMQKGVGYANLSKTLYDITNTQPGQTIFKAIYATDLNSMAGIYLFFRTITAFFAIALTIAVYKLAGILYSNKYTGVLSAFFISTLFGSFFSSVIFKADIPAVFMLTCMLIYIIKFYKEGKNKYLYTSAIFFGFACVTKYHAAAAILLYPILIGLNYYKLRKIEIKKYFIAGLFAFLAALILGPYIFLDLREFRNGLLLQNYYQTNRPLQFEEFGFQPFVIFDHILYTSIGPVLLIFFIASLVFIIIKIVKYKKFDYVLPASYLVTFFTLASISTWIVVRYSIPFFPIISIFSSIFLTELVTFAAKKTRWKYLTVYTILAFMLFMHFAYFIAFSKFVRSTTATVQAANWIRENLDKDNTLLHLQLLGEEPNIIYNFGEVNTMEITGPHLDEFIVKYEKIDEMQNFEYLLIDERSYHQYQRLSNSKYESYHKFFESFMNSENFELSKKFTIVPEFAGIKFEKGELPQDLLLTSPDVLLYKRVEKI